jgi:hypothetical protein
MVDFKGERRTNATHESTTDAEAKLMRRGWGQPAKLSFGGHALMDNRAGLCADLQITDVRLSEPLVAEQLLARQRRKRVPVDTLGADKGYCTKAFVAHLRERGIRPHIACIEEIFGWLKTVGGLRKSRFIAIERTQLYAYLAASAYNHAAHGQARACNHVASPSDQRQPPARRLPIRQFCISLLTLKTPAAMADAHRGSTRIGVLGLKAGQQGYVIYTVPYSRLIMARTSSIKGSHCNDDITRCIMDEDATHIWCQKCGHFAER